MYILRCGFAGNGQVKQTAKKPIWMHVSFLRSAVLWVLWRSCLLHDVFVFVSFLFETPETFVPASSSVCVDLHVLGSAGRHAGVRLHGPRAGERGVRAGGTGRDLQAPGGLAVLQQPSPTAAAAAKRRGQAAHGVACRRPCRPAAALARRSRSRRRTPRRSSSTRRIIACMPAWRALPVFVDT